MTQPSRLLPLFFAVVLAVAACTGTQEVAQAPTSTLAPIVSMTPRFTATPVSSRTPLPTFTLTPSETPIPPTPSDTPTPTDPPPLLGVIRSSQTVNVREGPGTSFRPITALAPGTGVVVLGQSEDGNWYNIQMEDGDEGWISASLLRLRETPTPLPTLTPTPDLTALALGTPLPTSILGGGTVTPTPPLSAVTPTPVDGGASDPASDEDDDAPINLSSFNMTATALVSSITGGATAQADQSDAEETSSGPVGGPTGGPLGPTPTRAPGQGSAGSGTNQQGVDVLAYCDDPRFGSPPPSNLSAGASIDVYWSWFARTREQLQDHLDNVNYDVRVNGEALNNWRLYTTPVTQQEDGNFYQYWYVPFGPLEPGEYTISYRVTWDEAISDGYQQFGPGTGTVSETGSCTFQVR